MNKNSATPRPWKVGRSLGRACIEAERCHIATMQYEHEDLRNGKRDTDIANAQLIVKAVNMHDKLVEALSVFYHNSLVSNNNPIKESLMVEAQEKARQALKSAGEI